MNPDSLQSLWALAFGDSREFIDLFFKTAYVPERCRAIIEDGQAIAALYWLDTQYTGQNFAYIYGVATHPDYRNRGLCRKLMTETHSALKERGYAGALLMPAKPNLRQMYAKLGYRECSTISQFDCAAGTVVGLRAVSMEEYAALRRQYLPSGGLIQEGENLSYLQTYASVYAGENFLLAAVHEEDSLFGMELLGDADAAPGILAAMGYEKGTFRTPGEEIPFAMYLPLREDAKAPTYLGLAFD